MWTLKIKVREKWNLYNKRTAKFKVKLYFYSQSHYFEKNKLYFIASGIIYGERKKKAMFFNDLKKDDKISHLERNDDFFISIYCEDKANSRSKAVKIAYNPRIIFLKPVIIDEEGWEEWEIASTEREDLEKFIKYSEKLKNVESKLFYIKEKKVSNLSIYTIMPKLTEKQKQAINLAIQNGYFGYPRKIKLKQLAKQMKVSLSTYQFHLARAESKLMPFLAKRNISE